MIDQKLMASGLIPKELDGKIYEILNRHEPSIAKSDTVARIFFDNGRTFDVNFDYCILSYLLPDQERWDSFIIVRVDSNYYAENVIYSSSVIDNKGPSFSTAHFSGLFGGDFSFSRKSSEDAHFLEEHSACKIEIEDKNKFESLFEKGNELPLSVISEVFKNAEAHNRWGSTKIIL